MIKDDRPIRYLLRQPIMQHYVEQRFVYFDVAVVGDVAQFPKPVHEVADARSCGSNHVGEDFLSDGWDSGRRLPWPTKFSHEEQRPRQTLLTVVEELIDKIFLGSNSSKEHKLQEEIGELMLLMQQLHHLLTIQLEGCACGGCSGGRDAKPRYSSERLLAEKITGGKKRDRGLFPPLGDYGELCPTDLEKEDRIRGAALRKEDMVRFHMNCLTRYSRGSQVTCRIEFGFLCP